MPPTQASAKIASASSSSSVSAQVQKRATAPRPTGKTVVRASAARAAGRAAAAAATRSARDNDSARSRALAQLKDLAAAFGGIAQADLRGLAAAVQLPNGVTLLDVAVAVDATVERAERAVARVERPGSPCYSPNSPEAPPSPSYAPSSPTVNYYPCAYECVNQVSLMIQVLDFASSFAVSVSRCCSARYFFELY